MNTDTPEITTPALTFEAINWVGTECLPRDQEQSHRLHEPTHMDSSIDPITGNDVANREQHPHLDDGILTVYFESETTQKQFLSTPFNHPCARLAAAAGVDADRGG